MATISISTTEAVSILEANLELPDMIQSLEPTPTGLFLKIKPSPLLPALTAELTFTAFKNGKATITVNTNKAITKLAGLFERQLEAIVGADFIDISLPQITIDINALIAIYINNLSLKTLTIRNGTITATSR